MVGIMIDIEHLNTAQKEAVMAPPEPLLVLAGAGSGKTRVLTTRIARMIEELHIPPSRILAITFTNKAAHEMRERLFAMLGEDARGMWISTFHSMGVRILRREGHNLGYTSAFTIYDTDDAKRLIKKIMGELYIDTSVFAPQSMLSYLSNYKTALLSPDDAIALATTPAERESARIYKEYEKRIFAANAMDFDDLLVNTYKLFDKHPDVLARYQEQFMHIAIDEYQDTNHVQYLIVHQLSAHNPNLSVVGDDDQSIYSWRGADISNILEFEKDHPSAHVVKLEQNYRSKGHILHAANAVVCNNHKRKQKRLFTEAGDGNKVNVYQAPDEREEGRWVAAEIQKCIDQGYDYSDIAVFYRTNVQSRILEDMLLRGQVPYQIVGGTRFFERKEIRDIMAYLKLIKNPADDISAERIINEPRRGLGSKTQTEIAAYAREHGVSFYEAAKHLSVDSSFSDRVKSALMAWVGALKTAKTYSGPLAKTVEMIMGDVGLISALEAAGTDEAQDRIANLHEFLQIAQEFDETHEEAEDKLAAFLEWLTLRTDLDTLSDTTSAVTLMTIHSAKGLEFPVVFVTGMEEGLFPSIRRNSDTHIEEERRLAYVAITRAKEQLYLTYATSRHMYGSFQSNPPSQFLREIPDEDIAAIGLGSAGYAGVGWEKRGSRSGMYGIGQHGEYASGYASGARTRSAGSAYGGPRATWHEGYDPDHNYAEDTGTTFGAGGRRGSRNDAEGAPLAGRIKAADYKRGPTQDHASYAVGDTVMHRVFGKGTITEINGDMVVVHFERHNKTKKLLIDYAPLVKIDK